MSLSVLLILGIGAFGGVLGAWFFQKLRIPQVVGYIAIGLLIGRSGLDLVRPAHMEILKPFNFFALGIIGFLVGGELKGKIFRQYGRQFTAILLGEGLLAFSFVTTTSTVIVYMVSHNFAISLAAGIVFGAIASATDPASTIDVLWEYRSLGKLTTALIATVALDDALAMTLYGLGKSVAELLAVGTANIGLEMLKVFRELGGAVLVGAGLGFLLTYLLRHTHQREKSLALSIGAVLLAIGISTTFDLDLILTTMTLGIVLTNFSPRRAHELFDLVRTLSIPVYVLFFVLVGARLYLGNLPGWLWVLVVLYVVGRNVGKMAGTFLAARATRAAPVVQKYCGMGLFAQGGVAVGLSIMASQHLGDIQIGPGLSLGEAIIFAVTATTLIAQIIGPPMVKWAIHLAGEAGRNLTEDDATRTMVVSDVIVPGVPIPMASSVADAVEVMANSDTLMQPVVDAGGKLVGTLSFEHIRELLQERDTWAWILAADIMGPSPETVAPGACLSDAVTLMNDTDSEEFLVADPEDKKPMGVIHRRGVKRAIREKLLHLRGEEEPSPEPSTS